MNKAIGFLYYVNKENGLETVDIIAETDTSYILKKNISEWIIKKSELSDDKLKGHPYTFSYKVAKEILTNFINIEITKIEDFRKQLLKD
jgi:hypothetical protein